MNQISTHDQERLNTHACKVKQRAAELGFDACGVAAANPPDPENRLEKWLKQGYHADMAWIERTQAIRKDITQWLPGARSVVVVARNYYYPAKTTELGSANVARYAWGRDYHRVLLKPLRQLSAWMHTLDPEASTKISIDTQPVLERAWAARAGVGWIGKNSLVLRRDIGSWFFLGIIATTIPITPDHPVENSCAACFACMKACPTQAIVEPGIVDSRRCIAYHTIENRGEIPKPIQTKMGDWVFGCDLCQEVCPWNHSVPATTESDFKPRPGVPHPDVSELAEMDAKTFLHRFQGTPLMRAKNSGIRRNAQIILQNRELEQRAKNTEQTT